MDEILVEKEISAVQPVSFTESAVKEVERLFTEGKFPADQGLRVGVKGGGCSGLTYILGFDARQEGDDQFQIGSVKVFMNKSHQLYLYGMEIDFQSGLNARGFVFTNPNATKTCGCGTSFSA